MVKWGIPEKMMNMQFRRVDLRLISPQGYLSGFNIKTYSVQYFVMKPGQKINLGRQTRIVCPNKHKSLQSLSTGTFFLKDEYCDWGWGWWWNMWMLCNLLEIPFVPEREWPTSVFAITINQIPLLAQFLQRFSFFFISTKKIPPTWLFFSVEADQRVLFVFITSEDKVTNHPLNPIQNLLTSSWRGG